MARRKTAKTSRTRGDIRISGPDGSFTEPEFIAHFDKKNKTKQADVDAAIRAARERATELQHGAEVDALNALSLEICSVAYFFFNGDDRIKNAAAGYVLTREALKVFDRVGAVFAKASAKTGSLPLRAGEAFSYFRAEGSATIFGGAIPERGNGISGFQPIAQPLSNHQAIIEDAWQRFSCHERPDLAIRLTMYSHPARKQKIFFPDELTRLLGRERALVDMSYTGPMGLKDLARRFNVSTKTISRRIEDGGIPSIKSGKFFCVLRDCLPK